MVVGDQTFLCWYKGPDAKGAWSCTTELQGVFIATCQQFSETHMLSFQSFVASERLNAVLRFSTTWIARFGYFKTNILW